MSSAELLGCVCRADSGPTQGVPLAVGFVTHLAGKATTHE